MVADNQVQMLVLPEINLVGLCVTSPFKGHLPERVEDMKQEFHRRKDEIRNVIHPERYVSPSFTSEVLFTYLICMEVASLSDVPEGMLGFTIPPHRYAKVKSKGDPYQDIHDYLKANNKQSNKRALALEIYHFENPAWPDEAEVCIPLLA
ncbi:GyrI-like domain-containing protein [Cohnella nanjingensis]|uniref:GyrI-like domain-containing protein n=1 Tax=Cohnella nanjingensis TaxID=1387779 RepID=A0A7X0VH30_9BACL|nr:GyrI-like domain-containing protein [Cohnella nanjingensis]MBB6673705.1 GyrI-like domain-containing protein [Cohnella nanjingensis]